MTTPICPKCQCDYPYEDGNMIVCPLCNHEWDKNAQPEEGNVIKDSAGNVLENGDTVTIVKTLKVKGAQSDLKVGTKVKNIRLIEDATDDHNIDCKIDGFGAMKLKSSVVKKA